MVKRLVAILVAVGLVAAAVGLRSWLDGGDEGGATGGPDTSVAVSTTASPAANVVCATELAAACEALEAKGASTTVEPAGTTAARLEADLAAADVPAAWITLSPWPQIVDDTRSRKQLGPLFGAAPDRLATSPLALIGPTNRLAVLGNACGGSTAAITWKCIGEKAGAAWSSVGGEEAWGTLKPGHTSPVDSAAGLLVFSNAVVSYFGRTDVSLIDFQTDDAFRAWLARLEGAVPTFGDAVTTPLDLMLVQPRFDVVGTTTAEISEKVGAQSDRFSVLYPSPMAQADAVMASTGALPGGLREAAAGALTASGWTDPAGDPTAGLPSPGAMQALQGIWKEVTR
jgi:hypothetical protein